MQAPYDKIGVGYSATRRPDDRIAARILAALHASESVVNVGAGGGSYEPQDRFVIAVEPSPTMIRQRPSGSAPVVQAAAEALPFIDGAFDSALAILTVHHWQDPLRGLAEMRRVARIRVVVLTWDQEAWESFWLIREYLPCISEFDRSRGIALSTITAALGECSVQNVPIPHDCVDGFHGAFWRRPAAYLDPLVRAGISTYTLMPQEIYMPGLERLSADLQSGKWQSHIAICCNWKNSISVTGSLSPIATHRGRSPSSAFPEKRTRFLRNERVSRETSAFPEKRARFPRNGRIS
jgi:SAM-dependent methyltransferase